MLNDQKLLRLIRFAPVAIIVLFSLIISAVVIQSNRIQADENLNALRDEVINQDKAQIKEQLQQVISQVRYEKTKTEDTLKKQARQRVYEAYEIAHNIYNNNHLTKSKAEITKMISDALRPIRFYEGRGYFFVFTMDGINVMHGLKAHLEGKSVWNAKDIRGTFILQEHIRLIDENPNGEAFYHWWYQKPGEPKEKEFEKIGFGKRFEPYDWFIGTGEYVADVESDIKAQVLHWISNYKYGSNGYIFVLDQNGDTLAHRNESLIGKNVFTDVPSLGSKIKHTLTLGQGVGGNFIDYTSPYKPNGSAGEDKVSYIQAIDEWGWILGTGFYVKDSEAFLAGKEKELAAHNHSELLKIITMSCVLIVLVVIFSLMAGNIIARRFDRFQHRISNDFNELEHTKNKMQHMALHDVLTGLPNRLLLLENIEQGINYSRDNNQKMAVMFADLDNFKKVNDLYGHSAGDKLLEIISRKFEVIISKIETVSRFGGDEFIFCIPGINNIQEAKSKVEQIQNVFQEQFIVDGKIMATGCSIGVSMFPEDGNDPEALIRKADIVLYKSKANRKGEVMFYDSNINEQVQYEYILEEELRHAVYKGEISVVYQPQVDVCTGKMVGVEALSRWNNSRLGSVSPLQFITVAEETGLIRSLGLFVFRKACEDIYHFMPNSKDALKVAINISPKQLMEVDFADEIMMIIKDVGIDIERVTLEVTENVLIDDLNKVSPILQRLRDFGFGISLDDFGTGYSSLSYLNSLPITEMKIDRCFVDKMLVSEQSDNLVKAIIAIGDSCNMSVLAEGVENKEQFRRLLSYGCGYVQGYYFAKPLSVSKLHKYIAKQASA